MTEGGMRPNWQTRLPSAAIRSSEKVGGDWSWKTGKEAVCSRVCGGRHAEEVY